MIFKVLLRFPDKSDDEEEEEIVVSDYYLMLYESVAALRLSTLRSIPAPFLQPVTVGLVDDRIHRVIPTNISFPMTKRSGWKSPLKNAHCVYCEEDYSHWFHTTTVLNYHLWYHVGSITDVLNASKQEL